MTTVDRIFQLINENKLTAKEFANKVGVSQGNITDWKTGRAKPSIESLQKIAKYTGVQLEWLTGDSEYKTRKEEMENLTKNINIRYKKKLLDLGISEKDVEDILSVNPLSIHKYNNLDALTKPMINKINYISQTYSPYIVENFISVMKNILLEEKSIIMQKDYDKLKQNYEKSLKASRVLVEYIENNNLDKLYMCPVYGRISAGQPNWAEECIEGRIPIDPILFDIIEPEEHFFLHVNGDSMNKVIRNGAYALIRKQDIVENGEIAVVLVDGDEATLKKFNRQGDLVILEPMSDDSSFQVQVYDKTTSIKILGKYVGKFELNK